MWFPSPFYKFAFVSSFFNSMPDNARLRIVFVNRLTDVITIPFTWTSFMERSELRRSVYSSHIPSSEKVHATQKGAKWARKHKNNNKIPVYFDNIILDGHKGRHVTSNRFRFLAALWEGFQTSFANNLLKSFFSAFAAVGSPCATVWRVGDERFRGDYNWQDLCWLWQWGLV